MTPMTTCPRCVAARWLPEMRLICDLPHSPDVNHHAHAAGIGMGALELLLKHPLALCEAHNRPCAHPHRVQAIGMPAGVFSCPDCGSVFRKRTAAAHPG